MRGIPSALIVLALVVIPARGTAYVQAQGSPPETAAMHRTSELVRLIDAGGPARAQSYLETNAAASLWERQTKEASLRMLAELSDRTRGLVFHSAVASTPTELTALFRAKLTEDLVGLRIRVEPEPPHRILEATTVTLPRAQIENAEAARHTRTDAEIVRELDAFLQRLSDADVFSGAVLLAKDGKPLFQKAYGDASKDFGVPNRTDTPFNLGSMNKMFTAVAIAQLAERGQISLDDPLSNYLPDFPTPEAAAQIRIRHLLNHASGMGNYFNRRFMKSSRARYRTVDDMLELIRGDTLLFAPGTRREYSNAGFLVLGRVIEKVSGKSYSDYVRENIYEPAGMSQTGEPDLDRVNPNLAVGYHKEYGAGGIRFRNNLFDHVIRGGPAGGGYSTLADMLRFAEALQANRLVGRPWVEQLLSPKPELNSPRYGFGFSIDPDRRIAGHTGGYFGIGANLDMFLDQGYTAVILSNYTFAFEPVFWKIRRLVPSLPADPSVRPGSSR